MVIPGVFHLLAFRFIPLAGSVIAFMDYSVFRPLWQSPLVGFKHFLMAFNSPDFFRVLTNTAILGFLNIVFVFPVPIFLSLMLNEVGNRHVKKGMQTIVTIPHFLSWVIVAGLTFDLFSVHGLFNIARGWLGIEPLLVMQHAQYFRPVYVFTALWREAGWNTIVYLAAISAIDPQIYESAMVDGASRFRQIVSITFSLLLPTAVTLLLLQVGNFLLLGFDQVYNLLTPMTRSTGDIIDTFVYRTGLQESRYSYATAIGLFQSVIGFCMVLICNAFSKKYTEGGLW
jgi:putative aldouronate transport system permease protein